MHPKVHTTSKNGSYVRMYCMLITEHSNSEKEIPQSADKTIDPKLSDAYGQ